jgi:hypothetical protein
MLNWGEDKLFALSWIDSLSEDLVMAKKRLSICFETKDRGILVNFFRAQDNFPRNIFQYGGAFLELLGHLGLPSAHMAATTLGNECGEGISITVIDTASMSFSMPGCKMRVKLLGNDVFHAGIYEYETPEIALNSVDTLIPHITHIQNLRYANLSNDMEKVTLNELHGRLEGWK